MVTPILPPTGGASCCRGDALPWSARSWTADIWYCWRTGLNRRQPGCSRPLRYAWRRCPPRRTWSAEEAVACNALREESRYGERQDSYHSAEYVAEVHDKVQLLLRDGSDDLLYPVRAEAEHLAFHHLLDVQ